MAYAATQPRNATIGQGVAYACLARLRCTQRSFYFINIVSPPLVARSPVRCKFLLLATYGALREASDKVLKFLFFFFIII